MVAARGSFVSALMRGSVMASFIGARQAGFAFRRDRAPTDLALERSKGSGAGSDAVYPAIDRSSIRYDTRWRPFPSFFCRHLHAADTQIPHAGDLRNTSSEYALAEVETRLWHLREENASHFENVELSR